MQVLRNTQQVAHRQAASKSSHGAYRFQLKRPQIIIYMLLFSF